MEKPSTLHKYPDYECVIGIEVHVQLETKSKIFCGCSNQPCTEPNKNICQICAGYPGVLPVLNKEVINYAVMAGLATHCTITPISEFARKHYFYPDLPKGFQITQHTDPICVNGFIPIRLEDGTQKNIRLTRIHIEEDAGKNIHSGNESFVDYNRAGTPLLEMVSEPDISDAYQARAYLKMLRAIVMYLGISTGNMQEGSFRADTNISVRKKGEKKLGTKVELKNINSFKFISDAIEFEIERQIQALQSGQKIKQETRLWDTKEGVTKSMRSKEEAADYRYFPEPDLPYIEVTQDWVDRIQKVMPEMPYNRFERYIKKLGLSVYEAEIFIDDLDLSRYFEKAREYTPSSHLVNWILRDVLAFVNEHKISLDECKVTPERLAELVNLIDQGVINNRAAQEIFLAVAQTGKSPKDIVKEQGLEQVQDPAILEKIAQEIISQNPKQVEQYRAGNERLLGFFVGQAMKKSNGKGNPQIFDQLFKKLLS